MALLTVSKESALTEAGNFVLTSSVFHGVSAELWLLRVRTPRYWAFYAYTASTEIRCLQLKTLDTIGNCQTNLLTWCISTYA